MDENLATPVSPSYQCAELKCEYCASSCRNTHVACMYTTPSTPEPTECPLNKW